jgi:hypothetical protein
LQTFYAISEFEDIYIFLITWKIVYFIKNISYFNCAKYVANIFCSSDVCINHNIHGTSHLCIKLEISCDCHIIATAYLHVQTHSQINQNVTQTTEYVNILWYWCMLYCNSFMTHNLKILRFYYQVLKFSKNDSSY